MSRKRIAVLSTGVLLAVGAVAGGSAAALTGSGSSDDPPLTGSTLEQATAAALAHTGGGTVIETEAGDDGAAYGVEIALDDGSVVEVNLDESFSVIGQELDDDGSGDGDGPNDD